jgi:hypothetical protein
LQPFPLCNASPFQQHPTTPNILFASPQDLNFVGSLF